MPSLTLSASYISKAHTICASAAFLAAFLIGSKLHYRKIVKNDVAGYPDEWWPSVSATIGDWYPERSIFQILIALTAGPRFLLVLCWWLIIRSDTSSFPTFVALCGILRTFSCGGWVYITSSDDHDAHDILMILYIVLNLPWMIGSIICTPKPNTVALKKRVLAASTFFLAIVPLVYFFIQHKVHRIPGAYTRYSFFEWSLIASDIWFDSITSLDFSMLHINIGGASHQKSTRPSSESPYLDSKVEPKTLVSPKLVAETSQKDGIKFNMSSFINRMFYFRTPGFSSLQHLMAFASDFYLSYIWWSIFTVLVPSLFYFSVWELSISGQEMSLASVLSPFFLGFHTVFSYFNNHRGQTILQFVLVMGLIAYAHPSPLIRLFIVSLATMAGSLLKALEWRDPASSHRQGIMLILGLALSSLSKLVNHTVNPVWSIVDSDSGGWNKTGIVLGLLAVWNYATREDTKGYPQSSSEKMAKNPEQRPRGSWILPSIGLGGLIFSLQCFLSDADTLVVYSWTGYPVKGPFPGGVHACLTLIAMSLGVLISHQPVVKNPLWVMVGPISAYFMYRERDWKGYYGGLALAVFLCSLSPTVIQNASMYGKSAPSKVYGTAWVTFSVLILANVWTVAYAFVPAGWILRERTDIVLGIQMFAVSLGVVPSWLNSLPSQSWLLTSATQTKRYARNSLMLMTMVAIISTTSRIPIQIPRPHRPGERLITAGIWTVHFGIDNEGRDSQYRMRDLIKDMELDIIGLLETDLHRIVFGNRDLTRVIAEDLGYYVDLGPGPNEHTWGAVLLSKFPILESTHHLLPSPHGELAPAISAVLDVWGRNVTVVVAHNGQEEDPLDRELQSAELARIMAASFPEPVIFLGYVVTLPHAPRPNPYDILITDGLMHDIDDQDMDRWCEYILYRGLYRTAFARVSRSTITDTELQVGKFVLPRSGHAIVNASREERYLRDYREVFPPTMWFPDRFLQAINPEGVRGHYYHVNPWPLYYRLPENAVV